jgi:hypothetical protein
MVPAVFLVLLAGCASVKDTLRDTHRVLITVAGLTEHGEEREVEQLYLAEDRIYDSCSPLLRSTNFKLLGEDIPLLVQLGALLSSKGCQQTVDQVRVELDAVAGHRGSRTDTD